MIDVDCRVHEAGGVSLVSAVVENAAPTPRRIALEPRIDGTVLPPRTRGLPARGWSDEGFTGVAPAEGRLALGFACRGGHDDPPVAVVDEGRPPRDDASSDGAFDPPPTAVLRALESPVPPRDAVPDAVTGSGIPDEQDSGSSSERGSEPNERGADSPSERAPPVANGRGSRSTLRPRNGSLPFDGVTADGPDRSDTDRDGLPPIPAAVADWLDGVATRVERAANLADARDLEEGATAVDAVGGIAGVERLLDALEADERAVRAVADRASDLADDCEVREDVPVDVYRELA